MTDKVLTANRLTDGITVWMGPGDRWVENIAEARIVSSDAEFSAMEELGASAVASQIVVEPYLIDVEAGEKGPVPVRYREKIRAYGPSIRPDLAFNTEQSHTEAA